jgi:hypothetical protein
MILDAYQMFDLPSNPRNLAQATGDYASTNILDYGLLSPSVPTPGAGVGSRDMGVGHYELKLLVQIGTAFASGGAGTLAVALQGSIADANGDPAAWTTWWSSPTYALATLVAGARLLDMDFPRPPAGIAIPRFVRLLYTVGGATMTAGTVVAGVVLDRFDQPYSSTANATIGGYPAGITVAN